MHESIDAPLDSIRAWVTDVPREQFMSAGTLAADRRRGEAAAAPGAPPGPPVDPIMGVAGDPLP